ncbi:HAD superfamily hydrolase (TIGR01509 family) [Streptomyces sp. 3211.6]|uniref:HAD family hydrolase n=1 Tax=Streptomyces sp. 3211.6 TaxID=1938845 RepID=UPI000EB18841|nr:HAD family phosphatase [Streptomyces sp. 3211.6]RKT08211.1 HAD superfamily hydrolase (TIGR01509 family) [Streptomyces sp. 3211.6]
MQHPAQSRVAPGPRSAVVFDCDGLLITTERAWDLAYESLFTRHGAQLDPAGRNRLRGLGLEAVGRVLSELLHQVLPAAVLASQALDLMESHLEEVIAPMPGAVDLVAELSGTRPLAVASNAPTDVVRAHLQRFFDLADLVIIGGDMVRSPKPQPEIYLAACEVLASPPAQTWALEDSATGATAAYAAGLYVVGVPQSSAGMLPCHIAVNALDDPRLHRALIRRPAPESPHTSDGRLPHSEATD